MLRGQGQGRDRAGGLAVWGPDHRRLEGHDPALTNGVEDATYKSLLWLCFILLTHCLSPVGAFPHPAGRESEEEQASQAPARSCLLLCSDSPQPRLTCGMALIQLLPLVQPLLGHEGPSGEEEHAFGSVDPSSIPGLPLTSCSS